MTEYTLIPKAILQKILENLPDDWFIATNGVGISLHNDDEDYVGYVDFMNGSIHWLDEED